MLAHPAPPSPTSTTTFAYVFLDLAYEFQEPLVSGTPAVVVLHLTFSGNGAVERKKLVDILNHVCDRGAPVVLVASDRLLNVIGLSVTDDRSWEGFADDCVEQLSELKDSLRTAIARVDHLVIRHKAFAAIHLEKGFMELIREDRSPGNFHYLVYPQHRFAAGPGFLRGYNTLLGVSVFLDIVQSWTATGSLSAAAVQTGILAGLRRCTVFDRHGFCKPEKDAAAHDFDRLTYFFSPQWEKDCKNSEDIAGVAICTVPMPGRSGASADGRAWSVIDQRILKIGEHTGQEPWETTLEIAREIVKNGIAKIASKREFPVVRFGKMVVTDRHVFEDVWEIQAAMRNYLSTCREVKQPPLCLAVFGSPGSGKSFAVKELAKALRSETLHEEIIEVNVSQYDSAEELEWVFRKVRDISLQDSVPLVFFDEFDAVKDSESFGWQKSFLAPMQDRSFGTGPSPIVYRYGIFIFVGGISPTFEVFNGRTRDREFRNAKGPDFVSRLVRHYNVLGITHDPPDETMFMIRRAVILRQSLWDYQRGIFAGGEDSAAAISDDVCNALLTVRQFRHGVRSLEAIVRTSRLHPGRPRFHWAVLPPPTQLDMHVDVELFRRARSGARA